MDFDIVLPTLNREAALKLSVPLMLSQNRLPSRFVVVDASNNHNEVREIIEQLVNQMEIKVDLLVCHAKQPGTSRQRNIGLRHVQSPIVLFPDDDALWFPGVTESIMRIYERDSDGSIGGVCATESLVPPPGIFAAKKPPYRMEFRDRLQLRVGRILDKFENAFFPDPIYIEGYERYQNRQIPDWLSDVGAVVSVFMSGFRMSFRSDLIRSFGFDENLGRFAIYEDRDASLGALTNYLIVRAEDANVFHYRSPEKRVSGVEWATMHILNRAYVVCKHSPPGSTARHLLKKFSYYKLVRYLLQAQTRYGRQRVVGALRALSRVSELVDASPGELVACYKRLRDECLSGFRTI